MKAIARNVRVSILPDNSAMLQVSREVGFALEFDEAEGEWKAELNISS